MAETGGIIGGAIAGEVAGAAIPLAVLELLFMVYV